MPQNRFFLDQSLSTGDSVQLRGDELRHIKVMRPLRNDKIELVNGRHQLASTKLISLEKEYCELYIESVLNKTPPSFPIILCQAMPKLNKLDLIVEKATEIGATDIYLFFGEKSIKKEISDSQIKRLKGITLSAMKQCGRLDLPTITLKPPLQKWQQLDYPAYYGAAHKEPFSFKKNHSGIMFFIGPESGFSQDEEKMLIFLKAQGVNLNPNTLRSETAAIVACTMSVQLSLSLKGDLK